MTFKNICLNKILTKIHQTPLYAAVEKENIEIIKLLLTNENIDANILNIFHHIYI